MGERRRWLGLGAAAVVAFGVVMATRSGGPREDPSKAADAGAGASERPEAGGRRGPRDVLERPAEATCELAILVEDAKDLDTRATARAVAERLSARHCGPACGAVKKLVLDPDAFEIERMTTDQLVLPAKDTWDSVAAKLTPAERASLDRRPVALVVRTRGPGAPDHVPARAAFAATLELAESLSGLVFDETLRRIVAPRHVAEQVITRALGEPVLVPQHLVVQLYQQGDGTARMLTLGMARFGAPDVALRSAAMADAPALASVVNAVAAKLAAGESEVPLEVALDRGSVALDASEPARTDGDPDNLLVELAPSEGASPGAWSAVVGTLLGRAPQVVAAGLDPELEAVADRARHDLPSALRSFERGEGALFVKGPFPIGGARDGGPFQAADAGSEWMWIDVRRCDPRTCTGVLTNAPAYATSFASGDSASIARAEIADWLLRLPDGGSAGGESIRVLEGRAAK